MDEPWKLKIFFSVDLVSSTLFKAKKHEKGDDVEWCIAFQDFVYDFPAGLEKEYSKINSQKFPQVDTPPVWKMLGDEILFYSDLKNYRETVPHVIAFASALKKYNDSLDSKNVPIIRCKGTVWLAGFPLSNIEISYQAEDREITDFIGPSIDTGFRIGKHSTKRKLCLSVESVYMLCEAIRDIGKEGIEKIFSFRFRFEGLVELQGVFNNTPYPVFWIDLDNDDFEVMQDKWLGKGEYAEIGEIILYCENYLEKSEYLFKPFIYGGENKFNEVPDEIKNRMLKALTERIKGKESQSSDEVKKESETGNDMPASIQNEIKKTFD